MAVILLFSRVIGDPLAARNSVFISKYFYFFVFIYCSPNKDARSFRLGRSHVAHRTYWSRNKRARGIPSNGTGSVGVFISAHFSACVRSIVFLRFRYCCWKFIFLFFGDVLIFFCLLHYFSAPAYGIPSFLYWSFSPWRKLISLRIGTEVHSVTVFGRGALRHWLLLSVVIPMAHSW